MCMVLQLRRNLNSTRQGLHFILMPESNKQQNPSPLVEVNNLGFSRGSRVIYEQISLTIPRGKVTAIMGPSGIGKTTLLKLIGGQLTPDHGQVLFDGQDIHKLSRHELFEARKRMSMLFQSGALFTDMNVFDNVAFALREHSGCRKLLSAA